MLPDSNGYSCIAKDDTGYICLFSYQSIFRIGDQIKVFGYKDEYADLTCELVEIVAREVDLDLTPTILSPSEFNESLNDLDYGEYVQTTGYIVLEEDEYDYLLYFVVDGVKYPLEFTDYQVVMPLEESIGYPVELRFYLLINTMIRSCFMLV